MNLHHDGLHDPAGNDPAGNDPATDDALVRRVRSGDVEAFGRLFVRHRGVATGLAIAMAGPGEADDVVAAAFERVLAQIAAGLGPVHSFRGYLLAAVRHDVFRRARHARRCEPRAEVEPPVEHEDPVDVDEEVMAAYRSLPRRWQHVLWWVEIEGVPPRDLAVDMGLTPNAVSALACRARAGLRAAYHDARAA